MFANNHVPVIIVGAGPVGLAAANLLGAAGIATLVIERNAALSALPKAIALDDESLRICQAMHLTSAMQSCIISDCQIECRSQGRLLAKVAPAGSSNSYPAISTFHQPEFEAVLLDGLRRFSCVEVRFQHTFEALEQDEERVIVAMRTPDGTLQRVACTYLLACDGGRSSVRHTLNIPLRGSTFAQKWLAIDAIAQPGPIPIIQIFCDSQRPAVSIPAPHQGRRLEFMLLPGETEQQMLKPTTISMLLEQTGTPPQAPIIRKIVYSFRTAQARSFSRGRVFLLGDAAHMMPPFGGQGLNSGLRDAHNLVWKLAMVLQHQAPPQLLATYHQERSRHAAQIRAFASRLGALFMTRARPLAYCRNQLISILPALPITRAYLKEMRMKPQTKYKAGFFIFKGRKSRLVGSLLPQPEVLTQEGQHVLLDEVLGTGFALLRCHPNPEEAFASVHTDFWQRLGARFVCIQTDDDPHERSESSRLHPLPVAAVRSADKAFPGVSQDYFVVVRPDRLIMGIFREEQEDAFVSGFQRLLSRPS